MATVGVPKKIQSNSAQYVQASAASTNTPTFLQKVTSGMYNFTYGTGKAIAGPVTGAAEELSRGTEQVLTDLGQGTEQALYGTARGLRAIGEEGLGQGIGGGLRNIGIGAGEGIGTGLASVGTGAGQGLMNFSKSLIPVAVIAVLAILAIGTAKGVARV